MVYHHFQVQLGSFKVMIPVEYGGHIQAINSLGAAAEHLGLISLFMEEARSISPVFGLEEEMAFQDLSRLRADI